MRVSDQPETYLGVTNDHFPCVLVRSDGLANDPPMQTARVTLTFASPYVLSVPNEGNREGKFHTLTLNSSTDEDVDTFLRVAEAYLSESPMSREQGNNLGAYFRSLVRLFDTQPAPDLALERQGLWGELFVMRQVRGYRFWATYWHSVATRIYDFSTVSKRIEVKTTTGQTREHRFSHRQLFALGEDKIAIASLMLTPDDAGVSLRELIDGCARDFDGSEMIVRLEQFVRRAGMGAKDEHGPSYSPDGAMHSLAWYWTDEVPHFRMEEPEGVSETHYKVDLSGAKPIRPDELNAWLDSWTPV